MLGWSRWVRGRARGSAAGTYEPLPLRQSASAAELDEDAEARTSNPGLPIKFAPIERRLSERQLSMIASALVASVEARAESVFWTVGGTIGPGLLIGSGGALAAAGPAGALVAFVLVSGE